MGQFMFMSYPFENNTITSRRLGIHGLPVAYTSYVTTWRSYLGRIEIQDKIIPVTSKKEHLWNARYIIIVEHMWPTSSHFKDDISSCGHDNWHNTLSGWLWAIQDAYAAKQDRVCHDKTLQFQAFF